MNKLRLPKLMLIVIVPILLLNSCRTAFFSRIQTRKAERQMAGSKRSSGKVREAPGVKRAKAAQAKKKEKNDIEYHKLVKESRKHAYEIQSDDVKERMNQNKSDIKARDKTKSKRIRQTTRKAGRKYNT